MCDLWLSLVQLVKDGARARLASGDFYVTRQGDQYLLSFEDGDSNQRLDLGGIRTADVDAAAADLGTRLDPAQVTIHPHGETQCGEVGEGVTACCASQDNCQIRAPMHHFWCLDWQQG